MSLFARKVVPVTEMQARRAALLLGFNSLEGITVDLVRNAFRNAVKEAHPDAGGNGDAAAYKVEKLVAARQMLLKWIEALPVSPTENCPFCKDERFVRTVRFGVKPCVYCTR